jgi:pimeloyl-ACP methyl ester carboxylesterase
MVRKRGCPCSDAGPSRLRSRQGHVWTWSNRSLCVLWTCLAFSTLAMIGCTAQPSGTSASYYVDGNKRDRVLVFVHGLTGTATETWRCPDGRSWPERLRADQLFDDWDIYVADYPSRFTGNRVTFSDLASAIQNRLKDDKVWNHREIAFVCHSLGGIVMSDLLLRHRENHTKVQFLYLYGVPQEGSALARVAALVGDRLGEQLVSDSSDLQRLENDWRAARFKARRYCAFETEPLKKLGLIVVPRPSATRLCDEVVGGIDLDHMSLVKPCSNRDDSYVALRNAMVATVPDVGWQRLKPLPGQLPPLVQNSPLEGLTLGKQDPLGVTARADLTKQRGREHSPATIDQYAFLSPRYAVGAAPRHLALLGGLKATMTVVAIEDLESQVRILDQSYTASATYSWTGAAQERVRFVIYVFPLSAEAQEIIQAEQPERLISTSF